MTGTECSNTTVVNGFTVKLTVKTKPIVSLTGTGCANGTLNLNSNVAAGQINWKYNGNTVQTVNASWDPNATTIITGLGQALGLFVDDTGNVYVSDFANGQVFKYTPGSATGIVVAGGNGNGNAPNQLNGPVGVCVDVLGNIYVADWNNQRVQKWAPGATYGTTVAGGNLAGYGANQLNYPHDICLDAQGNLLIANGGAGNILKWVIGANSGTTVVGNNVLGGQPTGICVNEDGDIFFTNWNNGTASKWSQQTNLKTLVATGLSNPASIKTDGIGNLFIADYGNSRVQLFRPRSNAVGETIVGGNG
jgi:streptogramin lyase